MNTSGMKYRVLPATSVFQLGIPSFVTLGMSIDSYTPFQLDCTWTLLQEIWSLEAICTSCRALNISGDV